MLNNVSYVRGVVSKLPICVSSIYKLNNSARVSVTKLSIHVFLIERISRYFNGLVFNFYRKVLLAYNYRNLGSPSVSNDIMLVSLMPRLSNSDKYLVHNPAIFV